MKEGWLLEKGPEFIESIGMIEGQTVLDFGCGEGDYTIPLARVVGEQGKVYAIDKKDKAIERLKKRSRAFELNNIERLKTEGELEIPLPDDVVDFVLVYDVIHLIENRKKLYREIRRILKEKGRLSLYPTHYDKPLVFSKMIGRMMAEDEDEIIEEVESCGFELTEKLEKELIHFRSLRKGQVFNFRRTD
ncbi:MAG: class I SAM-dependent methyltransferase [Candidatus Aenigmatarchaeota archaeon]